MKSASSEVWAHFDAFMSGFTAARELHARAATAGAFLECVCLGASILDAMLRVGIVLQHQLDKKTREIPVELILQSKGDKAIPEREIFRRAHAASVIDDTFLELLQSLYDQRNRVIHRYIISRITTLEVLSIARTYEEAIERLTVRVREIEKQQIELGVGITVSGPPLEGEEGRSFEEEIADEKHTPALARVLRRR